MTQASQPIPANKLELDIGERSANWFEVIEPPTNLKRKAVVAGVDSPKIDEAILAKAEEALQELSSNFNEWMHEEIAALVRASAEAEVEKNEETLDKLYHAAHNVKGQAHTLGFPLAGLAAASLCRLVDGLPDKMRLPMELVANHVNAISVIVREDVRDMEHKMACTIIDKLQDVSDDFIAHETERFEAMSAEEGA